MSLNHKTHVRGSERRRKRIVIPILYFIAEVVLAWLVLSLIQLEFNMAEWAVWAFGLFIVGVVYSVAKTVHIFQRQKDYLDSEDKT